MIKRLNNGNKIINNIHGYIFYYNKKGEFHRDDGPAYVYPNGKVEYWLNGVQVNSLEELIIKNIIE